MLVKGGPDLQMNDSDFTSMSGYQDSNSNNNRQVTSLIPIQNRAKERGITL